MRSENLFIAPKRPAKWRFPYVPALLIAGLWSEFALAAWWLTQQLTEGSSAPLRAVAVVVLLGMGVLQARLAWKAWRSRHQSTPIGWARWRIFVRWFLVGFVVCYGTSLLLGQQHGGVYFFAATMSIWYTAVLLPLVGSPLQLSQAVSRLQNPRLRFFGWSVYLLLMAPLCTELVLRVYAEFFAGPAGASYLLVEKKLSPGSTYGNRQVNTLGYWDDEFVTEPSAGVHRVAVLGGDVVLGDSFQDHFLSRIETTSADVEFYNFALPRTVPADYALQIQNEVAEYQPQMVLAFLSLGNDLLQEPDESLFDWKRLHTYRWGVEWLKDTSVRWIETSVAAAPANHQGDSYQDFLQQTMGQLAICRTPIDPRMHERWDAFYADLKRLVLTCDEANLPLALVLTPSEFQVNPVLAGTLRRRAGLQEEDLDWDLPQRRLATFAKQNKVQLIDLTPHLKLQSGVFVRNNKRLNAQGHAVAADVVGHFVRAHLTPTIVARN